jgi:hypothetical protein
MADVRNIIVGAAQLYVARGTGAYRPITAPGWTSASAGSAGYLNLSNAKGDLAWGSTQSAKGYLNANPNYWRDLGYTNSGLEVSYEPGYNDVMVDQLLDAARLFKSTIKVMLKTELTEGTLENVNLAFGQAETTLTFNTSSSVTGSAGSVNPSLTGAASAATLNIEAGALGDAPVERTIVAVGNAPTRVGATGPQYGTASINSASGFDTISTSRERVYVARRVVQVEASTHGLKRDSATVFPVQFRCLPDDNDLYDGAEYGVIIDRVYG